MHHVALFNGVINQLRADHSSVSVDGLPYQLIRSQYQLDQLTKKLEPLSDKEQKSKTAKAALDSFLKQELANRDTNAHLSGRLINFCDSFLASVLHTAARHVERILGKLDLNEVIGRSSFGPGANVGCGGTATSSFNKMKAVPTVTPELSTFAQSILESVPGWAQYHKERSNPCDSTLSALEQFPGGVFFTVPKSSDTDRGCEKQPIINSFIQKGIGATMRRRLYRTTGIDLTDQSRNRDAARRASLDGSLATIDLSNASNSISYWVVRLLLPQDWFHLMDITRTHRVQLPDGTWHELEMFSAMGNGFTFELESILFYAIVKSAMELDNTDGEILVYGDDIVCPTESVNAVISALQGCGFLVNGKKSFWHGSFRESCGGDFYAGHNITPLKLRTYPKTAGEWAGLANLIRRTARLHGEGLYCDSIYFPAWKMAVEIALSLKCHFGPLQLGGVIHIDNVVGLPRHPFINPEKLSESGLLAGSQLGTFKNHQKMALTESTREHPLTTVYALSRMRKSEPLLSDDSVVGTAAEYPLRRTSRWRWVRSEVFAPEWDVPFL